MHQFDFSRAQRSIDLEDVGERAIVLLVLGVGGRSVLLEVRLVCFDPQINRNCARGIHTHTHTQAPALTFQWPGRSPSADHATLLATFTHIRRV